MKYLAYAFILMSAFTYTFAEEDPIPLIDVVVERVPPGNAYYFATGQFAIRHTGSMITNNTQVAIDYLYTNGLTMFGTEATFMGSSSLRRDEAAAFFARFAKDILGYTENTQTQGCNFSDLANAHLDLVEEIQAACQLWLFFWSEWKFNPTATLTNAQALAVLIRLIDGVKEEPAGNWSANYYSWAQSWRLTQGIAANNQTNLDSPIQRSDIAKLIEWAGILSQVRNAFGKNLRPYLNEEENQIVLIEHRGDPHENINEKEQTSAEEWKAGSELSDA